MKWRGITYPCSSIFDNQMFNWFYWLWKRTCCKNGWHLLDEMISAEDSGVRHSLICDACDLQVFITEEVVEKDGK
jgi:hypothetical protein